MMGSVLTWRSRDGDLDGWLQAMVRQFGASPGRFQIQRRGPTRHFCAGNTCRCPQEIDNTYADTPQALAAQILSEAVDTVTFTASTPDHWSLGFVSNSRSRLESVRVFMPRASAWPLPAELSDTGDLYRLLTGLATLLQLPQPISAPADPVRYPRPIHLDGTVDSSRYHIVITGWGDVRLHPRGDTPHIVDRLRDLLHPREAATLPLRSLTDIVHLCEALEKDLGYVAGSSSLAAPDTAVPLPADARIRVLRPAGEPPSFEVSAGTLRATADHPYLSMRERLALLLCPQLYTACPASQLANWLPQLEKGTFARPGAWTVHGGRNWQTPRHRGLTMVLRALLDRGAAGQASVSTASAEMITVRGITLGSDLIELVGRTRVSIPRNRGSVA